MSVQCNLILDSCCDLPRSVIEREGVALIQFPYMFGEEQHLDDMFASFPPEDFYERIRKGGQPSTAQVPIPVLQQAFTRAAQSGVPTVYLAFSSGLSGTFATAQLIADQVREEYPEAELHLVDTGLASLAEGLLVYEALRQRERGLSASQLAQWAQEAKFYVNCLFMVDDLDCLARGGRLPSVGAYLGSKLDVKPLVSFDLEGHLSMSGVARGRKKAMKQIVEACASGMNVDGGQTVIAASADAAKDLRKMIDMLIKENPAAVVVESSIGPVIGSHVGPGMVALVWWGADRREKLSISDRIARKVKGE